MPRIAGAVGVEKPLSRHNIRQNGVGTEENSHRRRWKAESERSAQPFHDADVNDDEFNNVIVETLRFSWSIIGYLVCVW